MMRLDFYLENKATGFIEFDTYDNLAFKYFKQNVLMTSMSTKISNISFEQTKLDIVNNYIEFKSIVEKINQFDYIHKIETDVSVDMTMQKLFDTHEYFEMLGEEKRTGNLPDTDEIKEMWSLATRMNTLIHKMEGTATLEGSQWYQALFDKPTIVRTELDDNLLAEAVEDYEENKIYIGYGETGKNIHHAVQFNEVDLITRQMIQPQRSILTEFFLVLGGDMPLRWDRYEEWCIENNVESYGYDYKNPKYWGKWPIGEIRRKSFDMLARFPVHDEVRISFDE